MHYMPVKSWKYKSQQTSKQNSRAKKSKTGKVFHNTTVRQYMSFILWSAQYATYRMSINIRRHSKLDRAITGKT